MNARMEIDAAQEWGSSFRPVSDLRDAQMARIDNAVYRSIASWASLERLSPTFQSWYAASKKPLRSAQTLVLLRH